MITHIRKCYEQFSLGLISNIGLWSFHLSSWRQQAHVNLLSVSQRTPVNTFDKYLGVAVRIPSLSMPPFSSFWSGWTSNYRSLVLPSQKYLPFSVSKKGFMTPQCSPPLWCSCMWFVSCYVAWDSLELTILLPQVSNAGFLRMCYHT